MATKFNDHTIKNLDGKIGKKTYHRVSYLEKHKRSAHQLLATNLHRCHLQMEQAVLNIKSNNYEVALFLADKSNRLIKLM